MSRQLLDIVGLAVLFEIPAVRMQAHSDGSNTFGDERALFWSHHPHGDIWHLGVGGPPYGRTKKAP